MIDGNLLKIILISMSKSSYITEITKGLVDETYFSDPSSRLVYKSIVTYYDRYQKLPKEEELHVMIKELYHESYEVNLEDVLNYASDIVNSDKEYEESFVRDQLEKLVKKVRSSRVLDKFVKLVEKGDAVSNETLVEQLKDALDVKIQSAQVFKMTDRSQLLAARERAVGLDDIPKIIKSNFASINSNLQYGGYPPGTVHMIVAPPGCFTGDTRIMTLDGKTHALEELYNNKSLGIYGCSKEGKLQGADYDSVYLSEYTDELVEVTIDNKYVVRCTPDHPFMLRDGNYKEAQLLEEFDELMPITRISEKLHHVGNYYESIYNKDNIGEWTHRNVAKLIQPSDEYSVVHHEDNNRYNNHPTNLKWFKSSSDHAKYHMDRGDYNEFLENGKATRITTDRVRLDNHRRWYGEGNEDYRRKMREVSSYNGKHYGATQLNNDEEQQSYRRKCSVLSFINKVLLTNPDISIDNYETVIQSVEGRKIHLNGIAGSYDCKTYEGCIDYDKLSKLWSTIIEDAKRYNHKVTSVRNTKLKEKVPVYGIVDAGLYHNYAIALDESHGVIVSNTGKSMFLMNEAYSALIQNKRVLHVIIGDLQEYDITIRYLSLVSGLTQTELVLKSVDEQYTMISTINASYNNILDRLHTLEYPAEAITVDQMIADIHNSELQLNVDYDMIIIDYPDNLINTLDNMYKEGGRVYAKLEKLARDTQSVIYVASQPKQSEWNTEIMSLGSASESSKKQASIDTMITMNKPRRDANIGTLHLAKVRKGTVGAAIRYESDMSRCKLQEIDEARYKVLKDNLE